MKIQVNLVHLGQAYIYQGSLTDSGYHIIFVQLCLRLKDSDKLASFFFFFLMESGKLVYVVSA